MSDPRQAAADHHRDAGPVGGSGIPAEAVEAAARDWYERIDKRHVGVDWELLSDREPYRNIVRPLVAAAVPVLLEAAAAEIETCEPPLSAEQAWQLGFKAAREANAWLLRQTAVDWTEGKPDA